MKVIDGFQIGVWYGGNRHNFKYYISNQKTADAWKVRFPLDAIYPMQLVIFDSIEEIQEHSQQQIREQALAKLTHAERKALGF